MLVVLGLVVGSTGADVAKTYSKLYYSRVEVGVNKEGTEITLTLYVKNPEVDDRSVSMLSKEGSVYTETVTYKVAVSPLTATFEDNKATVINGFDVNLNLYVAIYWDRKAAPMVCISVEPIAEGWWRVEDAAVTG